MLVIGIANDVQPHKKTVHHLALKDSGNQTSPVHFMGWNYVLGA